jgi:hypothetical protein
MQCDGSADSQAFYHGFEGGSYSKDDEPHYIVATDIDGNLVSEIIPNLEGLETAEDYDARVKFINDKHPDAKRQGKSILSDPIMAKNCKLYTKKEYDEFVADQSTRGVIVALFEAVAAIIMVAIEGAIHNKGNREEISEMLTNASEEAAAGTIMNTMQFGRFLPSNSVSKKVPQKRMSTFDFEREWQISHASTASNGYSQGDMLIGIEHSVSFEASCLFNALKQADENGNAYGPKKRDVVDHNIINVKYADLLPDQQQWISDTYETAFDAMQDFKRLVWYDLVMAVCPELFDHRFGPSHATMKKHRDAEFAEMLQTALYTENVYNYVLAKYKTVFHARMKGGKFIEALTSLLE